MPTTPTSTSGASGTTTITGGASSDNLVGGSGDDILNGGGGSDTLNGGSGSDILDGGAGLDTLKGGSGADTLIYKAWENQWKIGSTVYIAPSSGSGVTTTGTSFTGYDNYDGGSGSAKLGTAERDTVQIWLNPAQLANAALMAEIAYVQNIWIPQQLNSNTGQAGQAIYQFQNINLQISAVEQITIHNQFGSLDIIAPTVTVSMAQSSFNDGDNSETVTFTFSEVPTGFGLGDVNVSGGELTNLVQSAADPKLWTATFTAFDNSTTPVSIQVGAATFTDAAGNQNVAASNIVTASVDTVNPTVVVDIVDAALNDADDSSVVTFTFSEAVNPASVVLDVQGGTLSDLVWNADNTAATATFTADQDSDVAGSVEVVSYTDVVGNAGAGDIDTVAIDTSNPTVVVDIVDAALNDADDSSVVTFTFSEAVNPASVVLDVQGGTLSDLVWNADNTAATATFTADQDSDVAGSVEVVSYTDVVGNAGAGDIDTVAIDTSNPTVVVDIVDAALNDADDSSVVTFTFSEAVNPASVVLDVQGGTLSDLVWNADNTAATATFTADQDSDVAGSVEVVSYTDVVGNAGAGDIDTVAIDTSNPTVVVDIVDAALNDADDSSVVTFTFSEAVNPASVVLDVQGGTLSDLVWNADNTAATATFTADQDSDVAGSVEVVSYTDVVGNAGAGDIDTVAIDTSNPTVVVDIVDAALNDADDSSVVTFTFSEAVNPASVVLDVQGGTLSDLVWNADNTAATATFTADQDSDVAGSVEVVSYTDVVGNAGAGDIDTVAIDTSNPTVVVDIVDAALNDADDSSVVTFTFSEAVNPASVVLDVQGGTLSDLVWNADNTAATATFTADQDSDVAGSVEVVSYTDVVGNAGAGDIDTVAIDTSNPTVVVDIVDAALNDADDSSVVTFTFSEAVNPASVVLDVQGGTLSDLVWNADNTAATATFTADQDSDVAGSVEVVSYTDVVGNAGAGDIDTVAIDTSNPTVVVDIVDAALNDADDSSVVTFTFSEAVNPASVVLDVQGGTLSDLVWNADNTAATATFTADQDSDVAGSVEVVSYTDVVGNAGAGDIDTVAIDTSNPTVVVDIVDAALNDADDSSVVTFTFSEAVNPASVVLDVQGGTLSDLVWNADNTAATATFTADQDSDVAGSVEVVSYTDVVGNAGAGDIDTVAIDTSNPTVVVDIVDAALNDADDSSVVTFTFSEAVNPASVVLDVQGGTLSDLVWNADNTAATATFTADQDSDVAGSVEVVSYTDVVGNAGAGDIDTVAIDTSNPTVVVDIVDAALNDADDSSVVTFTFSEAVNPASVVLDVQGGTLSDLVWNADNTAATATFTADQDSDVAGSVEVVSYTDVVGNAGAGDIDTVAIDTSNPTVVVDIVDAALNDADDSSVVTFTFSEAVNPASVVLDVQGGTLSDLVWNADNTAATATFTADQDSDVAGSVEVVSYTDVVGNAGAGDIDTVAIDTSNPTVVVDIVDAALNDADDSSVVTFTFSEAVNPASVVLDVQGGTLSDLVWNADNTAATATFTADQDSDVAGSVEVVSYTDVVGNAGAGDIDTVAIDTSNPTVVVDIVDAALNDADDSSVVTFTFSEAVNPASVVLDVQGGTLSDLVWNADNTAATATFTADQDSDVAGSVEVVSYTDVVGNAGAGDIDTVAIDTSNPTVVVDIVDAALNDADDSSVVTFTFSEAVNPASVVLDVQGGTLSDLVWNADNTAATATFTADQDSDVAGSVEVVSYTDVVGNAGAGDIDTVAIDTSNPTVVVDIVDAALNDADDSSVVTFTFSEAVNPASVVLDVQGGTLSDLVWNADNTAATATFTADQDSDVAGSVEVVSYTDVVGNAGAGDIDTVAIDTSNPTVVVDIVDAALNDADDSSVVTFTFSEAVNPASVVLDVQGGTLSDLVWNADNTAATATFTADQDSDVAGSVEVVSYTDVVGNAGAGDIDTVAIDTSNPTVVVDIVDAALNDADDSSVVTFTFSEAVNPASVVLDVQGGTLSDLVWNADNTAATATFTADQDSDVAGSVEVVSYTDVVGNAGAGDIDTVAIDTSNPTVVVDIVDAALNDADDSSVVTFTFSEAVNPASVVLDVQGGTLSDLVWNADNTAATATFTADQDSDVAGSVEVVSYTDVVGNAGAGDIDTVAIDTSNPTVVVDIVDAALNDADDSSVVTFTFSEAVNPASVVLDVQGGTLSDLVWNADNTAATATFTADQDSDVAGSVEVVSYTDVVGNAGAGDIDTVAIDTSNPTATVDITAIAMDSGTVGDFITNDTTLSVSGTNTALGTGEKIQVSSDGGATWADVTQNTGTTWSYGDPTVHPTSFAYQVRVIDTAANVGNTDSQAVTIDTLAPTATVDITAIATDSGTVGDFVTNDTSLTVSGTNTALGAGEKIQVSSDGGTNWADVTQNTGTTWSYGDPTVHPTSFAYQVRVIDTAANVGNTDSQAITIDTSAPTIGVDITATSLNDGSSSSQVKFVFSEVPSGFTASDIHLSTGLSLVAGSLALDPSDPSGKTYVATVTANDGFTGTGTVTVNAGDYTDAAGNAGGAGSDSVTIDRTNPTANVNIVDTLLNDGDPSSSVTITFSEAVIGFSNADVTVVGGTLSALASSDGGVTWNATFTATDGIDGTGSVTVSGSYTDAAGNTGATGANDTVDIDRQESAFTADNLRFLLNTNNENEGGQSGQTIAVNADLGTFQAIGLPGTWTFSLGAPSTSFKIEGNHLITTAELQNFTTTLTINVSDGSSTIGIPVSVNIGTNGTSSISLTGGIDLGFGVGGKDTISGLAGNDSISGGSDNDTLDGGAGSDVLWGASGDDRLTGGLGSDVLTGGAGSDVFVFNVTPGSADADTITDFNATGIDHIGLVGSVFSVIGATVDSGEFRAGSGAASNAADANDYLLFDTSNGQLFYDADGNGSGARVLIATLTIAGITGGVGAVDYTDFNIL